MTEPTFVLSVTQLNTYVRSLLDADEQLSRIFITGEISNFTDHYRSGHLYFSLKDEKCVIRVVMFSQYAKRLRFRPQDGMKVILRGHVGIYETTGQYQLYAEEMQPAGLGALSLAFEQLKTKLEKEGLFSAERKKPIPQYPETIGVITSPTGAAVHDIFTVLARRYPAAQVVFCPVLVQGEKAAPQIVDALERMNRSSGADVLILGRGGGSLEDLWPFNEEMVARAVAASRIPVLSAVGHETDFTICDFVADLRAPTPSAAAELAVPDRAELLSALAYQKGRLSVAMQKKLEEAEQVLNSVRQKKVLTDPLEFVEIHRTDIDNLVQRMTVEARQRIEVGKARFSQLCGRLDALSPLAVLSRGYSILFDENGTPVSSVNQTEIGKNITIRVSDGELSGTVNKIRKNRQRGKERQADFHD